MSAPEVSVVIPCKNRARMLWDCFEGLAAQTLPRDRFEVVLVDNVSSDDLAGLCARARAELGLAVTHERMAEDRGPAPSRNRGVALARAPIIAFTDSDCRPEPGWLAAGLAAFDDPAVALVSGPVLPKPGQPVRVTSKITFVTEAEHPTFPTANAWYRRDLFLRLGGFDTALSFRDPFDRATEGADVDLAWMLIKAGHARRFLPEARVAHEVEDQPLGLWLIEGTRLFILPELVRRHPELRRELLRARLFFHPRGTAKVALAGALLAASVSQPWLLALPAAALVAHAVRRAGGIAPRVVGFHAAKACGDLVREAVVLLALLYGSLRFRCVVL
ncbi:glycosyltransferase [Neoroseomonas nitratireducens]|nr:glycosyltransferase [Neoroseomonas nitratireducens]